MTSSPLIGKCRKSVVNMLARAISLLLPPALMRDSRHFPLWQSRGYHVTPLHHYQPIPDTRALRPNLWATTSELVGINMHEEQQLSLLSHFEDTYKKEYETFPETRPNMSGQYYLNNGYFGNVDAEILYCMIRHFRPRRVVEVGSGFSTLLSAQAIRMNLQKDERHRCEFLAVEPFPRDILRKGFGGLSRLLATEIQDVPMDEFTRLRENDILFIDSSHVLRIGGDVQYEYLEIVPRLSKGVIVHVHDIFFPYEYPKEWVLRRHQFWSEQYLVQAFLAFNSEFEVLWASNFIRSRHPEKLKAAFSSYARDQRWPSSSLWIRRIE